MIKNLYLTSITTLTLLFSSTKPYMRRIIRFLALPYCFFALIDWKECKRKKKDVAEDLLYIFFKMKSYPDFYSSYRMWEIPKEEWRYYYGSSYDAYQRHKIEKTIQDPKYRIIFDDKEVCEQICGASNIPRPKYLGLIDPNDNYKKTIEDIIFNKLYNEIIFKPVRGSAGKGIIYAKCYDKKIVIRKENKKFYLEEFKLYDRSIIQEVVKQNKIIEKFNSSSINTIRITTLLNQNNQVILIGASMRFGINGSYIDNWSAGGVAIGVNTKTGTLKEIAFNKKGQRFLKHPNSGIRFKNFKIPQWNKTVELAKNVQRKFPYYKMIGVDIAISEVTPILIEINAQPDLVFQEQTSGPILKNKIVYEEFKKLGMLVNGLIEL